MHDCVLAQRRDARYDKHMPLTQEQLLSQALELTPAQRAALAESLWLSVDEAIREGLDAAWSAEVRRRIEDFDAGRAGSKPLEEAVYWRRRPS